MPPNAHHVQHNPSSYSRIEKDGAISRFSSHCKTFYRHSLSIHDEGSDEDANTSKDVMKVFNSLVVNQQQKLAMNLDETDANYLELVNCGFHDLDDQTIIELMSIRNEERRKAHQDGMKRRCKELHKIMDQINVSKQNDEDLFIHMKKFVTSYKQNIGFHSVFAGMRNLLESQIKNERQTIQWKFDSVTITESFDNTTINSKEYFKQVASIFSSYLVRVEGEGEENDIDLNGNMLCWKVMPSMNKRRIRKILNYLPQKRELYAKPTGTLTQTEIVRNVDKDCWYFW